MRSRWRKSISRACSVRPAVWAEWPLQLGMDIALRSAFGLALVAAPACAQQAGAGDARRTTEATSQSVAPVVDPLTGRPVTSSAGAVEQSVADRYSNASRRSDGTLTGTVPAYIRLPSVTGSSQGALQVRTTDRALTQRNLPGATVKERRRPEFDALGFRTGGLQIRPYVLAGLGYDSNVYAERRGRDDVVITGTAGVTVRSDWARNAIDISGNLRRREYGRFDSENATTYRLDGQGRLDLIGHNMLNLRLTEEKLVLDRSVADEVVSQAFPTRLRRTQGEVGGHYEQGPLGIDVTGRATRERFDDNASVSGAFVSQRFRDFDALGGNVSIGLDMGGLRSLYGEADIERRRFDVPAGSIIRDANVYKMTGGVRGAVTQLIRGHVGIGYMRVDFTQAGIKSLGAMAVDTELDWLYSQRTTFSLRARRDLRTVAQQNVRGTILTSLTAGVDHEWRYNVILSALIQQQWTDYIQDDRRARATQLSLGGTWLVDRHVQLRPQVAYQRRTDRGFLTTDASPESVVGGFDLGYRF